MGKPSTRPWAAHSPAVGAVIALGLMTGAWAAAAQTAPVLLPTDQATSVNGIEVACTGVGETRDDPQWLSYGVRIEFSDAQNQYLGAGAVRVWNRKGVELVAVECQAPWILLRLPGGDYKVEGWIPGAAAKPRSAPVRPPKSGQTRFVLQFPDA